MSWIMVDVEADGPVPGKYSMISFGAVVVRPGLHDTFYGQCRPISDEWVPEALAVSGHTRETTLEFRHPNIVLRQFVNWVAEMSRGRPMLISDNNGFDAMFMTWYLHQYIGSSPFGHSSTNLGSLYKGLQKTMFANFKHLRKTKHTHHPVDDAIGNAEALLELKVNYGLDIKLV